ncbi:MAG: hypothetical protein GX771_06835 [Halomonadaceae bacterium]|nr:hypothetical protein [Halomonadaceae bacterium]
MFTGIDGNANATRGDSGPITTPERSLLLLCHLDADLSTKLSRGAGVL